MKSSIFLRFLKRLGSQEDTSLAIVTDDIARETIEALSPDSGGDVSWDQGAGLAKRSYELLFATLFQHRTLEPEEKRFLVSGLAGITRETETNIAGQLKHPDPDKWREVLTLMRETGEVCTRRLGTETNISRSVAERRDIRAAERGRRRRGREIDEW